MLPAMAASRGRGAADRQAEQAAEESAEAREHALAATPQGQHDKDVLPDPAVTPLTRDVLVVFDESVGDGHGFYRGEEIKPGSEYMMTIGEATAVMAAGHGNIVGTEKPEDFAKREAAHRKEVARETARQEKAK